MPDNKLKNQVHASTFPIASWLIVSATMGIPTVVLAQSNDDGVVREAQPSQSVRDVLREEHALFSDRLTIEPGISYSYSDRSQLLLDGFLVLDAIFLGNISVDTVESHTTTIDLSTRYGVTDRLELELNIPYVYRHSRYESQDSGGGAIDSSLSEGRIGDISANMYYRLVQEGEVRPDIVWNFGVRAPTGKDPYGVSTRIVGGDENLRVPTELPTGDGVWGVSTGFSFLKTVDPAIVFANVGYTYNIEESFDDLDPGDQNAPGKVDLGDTVRFGFGTAFALNERFSLSMSLSYQHSFETKVSTESTPKRSVVGSSANAASVNFGATYGLTDSTSIVTSVGVGLTDDAPDFTLNFRMPFQI